MASEKRVLGIETSCDETAASVVVHRIYQDGAFEGEILSNIVRSQIEEHQDFGGVVPELAARAHVVHLDQIIERALDKAEMELTQIDGVGVTAGPGLIGGVLVGLTTAKALCAALGKPLIGVNHLEGHALTARLTDGVAFPYVLLLVSGGHTQILLVRGVGVYELWGNSIDDALGEAFDKVAKMLGLGYPGGPAVEKLAQKGDARRFDFPRPLLQRKNMDFSFSGLKTAVRVAAQKIAPLKDKDVTDICAGFQASITDIVGARARAALARFEVEFPRADKVLVVAGGVAANKEIGAVLGAVCKGMGAKLVVPPMHLCTDNGAMIGWAGAERLVLGQADGLELGAKARWPLDTPEMRIGNNRAPGA